MKKNKPKRIYRNKRYWEREASRQSEKLPSEKFRELLDDDLWYVVKSEVIELEKLFNIIGVKIIKKFQ